MKNIINYALRLLLVPVLLISFNSCENETISDVQQQQDNVTIEYNEEPQGRTTGIHYRDLIDNGEVPDLRIGGPTPDCPHEDCDTAIPATAAILQQIANELCREVWHEIACCMDGYVTYALMYALPQSPPCPIIHVPHEPHYSY